MVVASFAETPGAGAVPWPSSCRQARTVSLTHTPHSHSFKPHRTCCRTCTAPAAGAITRSTCCQSECEREGTRETGWLAGGAVWLVEGSQSFNTRGPWSTIIDLEVLQTGRPAACCPHPCSPHPFRPPWCVCVCCNARVLLNAVRRRACAGVQSAPTGTRWSRGRCGCTGPQAW